MRICFCGGRLDFPFDEGTKNYINELSQELDAFVVTWSKRIRVPFLLKGNYFVLKGTFLGRDEFLYFTFPVFLALVRLFAAVCDAVVFPTSNVGRMKYLPLGRTVHMIVSTNVRKSSSVRDLNHYRKVVVPRLKGIVVETESIRKELVELGVDGDKIEVIYPGLNPERFRMRAPPQANKFRILFASSPFPPGIWADDPDVRRRMFEGKGVLLLLQAFKDFSEKFDSELHVVWRDYAFEQLQNLVRKLSLEDRVKITNTYVRDMAALYANCHVAVIPYTMRDREIPNTGMEALFCGRPVVATDLMEFSRIVQDRNVGVVCPPKREALVAAISECREHYVELQRDCRKVAEEKFDIRLSAKKLRSYLTRLAVEKRNEGHNDGFQGFN